MDAMSANSLGDADSDDRLYIELSRVNNELINAQRDLVQRNVRLERAEEALRKAQADLERQVRERTRELENTVSAFREEVSVHRKTEEKLRQLLLTVLRIQDEERRHVARDLHDTVGQTLTALKITLSTLENAVARYPQTTDFFCELNGLADQALQEIRTTSYLLHPPLLDEVGFSAAAEWYVEGFAKRSGINAELDFGTDGERLPIAIETALFRVLQESLTNVHRYSGSSVVSVRFQREAEAAILEI